VSRELTIAGRRVADDEPAYVIAEIGNNHGGQLDTAMALIDVAARAKCAAVKFQVRDVSKLYSPALLNQAYENENSYGKTYGEHRHALELSADSLRRLFAFATREGLAAFATPFDERSADLLAGLGVPAFKVHSGGLTDGALLRHLSSFRLPVVVSSGGGALDDIKRAVDALGDCPHAILHCTASYPLKPEDANLRAILTLRNEFPDTVIGFSSHSPGLAFSLIAYAFGARIIEHHITLNRASKGTDHAFSLEPKGIAQLVEDLGKLQVALGDGVKRFLPCEVAPISKMRRWYVNGKWQIGTPQEQEPQHHA
jgi:sialic acid synthase